MMELIETDTFKKWRKGLKDVRAEAVIAVRLARLVNGLPGDVKPVGEGVGELRIHYGPGYRVYFKRIDSAIIVLLCGGDKSTQDKDITLAKKLAESWSP
ncbi:type II toxin-antitoxin system RelE/ParE family toxin [Dyella nitratireducens]|uniref:Addiction module antitoxin RelB n=1 Tax=Dyella nitratireducens TaxID=1849580 RepID=A0ABQ1GY65_9GAMM|nr:type II toxin-antitoxin system RelE/ParE family toxin [Dyella nitratireducens]GGA52282.1 addiction module antitoxin RelB [Dyella nitratireducens]GLQ41592.1 addiction module antitoxin RelB [Dyella nitratireducens]